LKKVISLFITVLILVAVHMSFACSGKLIHLGATSAVEERLLAEMAALMITERTGSTVKIDIYRESKDLYKAAGKGNIDLFFENTVHAAEVVGKTKDSTYEQIKNEFKARFNLTCLQPIGGTSRYAPILTAETQTIYPSMIKLMNKLTNSLSDGTFTVLLTSVEHGETTKKVAKEFLKGKRLI